MALAALVAILIPIAEIWAAIQVAHRIGWPATIALLVLISVSGPWLVRRAGTGVWRRARLRLQEGEVPGRQAIDGVLLLLAGGLLSFPGFITGVFGVLLLLPPVRSLVRVAAGAWLARKVKRSGLVVQTRTDRVSRQARLPGTVTADSHPVDHPRPPGRALGPPD